MNYKYLFNLVISVLIAGVGYVSLSTHHLLTKYAADQAPSRSISPIPASPNPASTAKAPRLEADILRDIIGEELALISAGLKSIEARCQAAAMPLHAAPPQRQDPGTPQQVRALRAEVDSALRHISRNNPSTGRSHMQLMRKIAQLPPAQRADAMRELNRRMNE